MSMQGISAIGSDLARVAVAQIHLAAAQAIEGTASKTNSGETQREQAAVAAAKAALAQAQAALDAARATEAASAHSDTDEHHEIVSPTLTHFINTVA